MVLIMSFPLKHFSRKDIVGLLEKNLKIDTLLLAGTKGSFGSTVQILHAQMDKQKTQLLKIDDIGDVINEAVRNYGEFL